MTKFLVMDSSFAVRLVTPHPEHPAFSAQQAQWVQDGFQVYVPTLWLYEVTSSLGKYHKFGQMTLDEVSEAIEAVLDLNVELVRPDKELALQANRWRAKLNRGAAYDSFYLALSERLQCDLWTADKKLVHAVGEPWVKYGGIA